MPVSSTEPAVSVILPTYNRAGSLGRAIESVLAQTFTDLELIVVDDGSQDETASVVNGFSFDRRVHYVALPGNRGAGAARNAGVQRARAQYLAFQDSDDEWMPDKLARHMDAFAAEGDVGVVYSDMERVLFDGTSKLHRSPSVESGALIDPARQFYHVCGLGIQSTVIRRECLNGASFNEALPALEDMELFIRLSQRVRFLHLPVPLVRYHESNGLSKNEAAKLEARRLLLELYQQDLEQSDAWFIDRERTELEAIAERLARRHGDAVGPDESTRPVASVCVCTFQRPEGLRRLLASLSRLDAATPPHEILVVDNDSDRTGERVVTEAHDAGLPVRYLLEPERGLARARNRLVHEARGEFIAFVDDDEEADPRWLVELCSQATRHGADGGVGPVLPRFDDSTPHWMIDGGFFERDRFPTGTVLQWKWTRTGNCLIRRSALLALPGPFNLAFDLTGGEDTEMFRRLIAGGTRLIAIDTAVVHEYLPSTRTTKRWLLRRWFRIGMGNARIDAAHPAGRPPRFRVTRSLARAISYSIAGGAVFTVSRIRGMRLLRMAARSYGYLAQCLGFTYHPYAGSSWR
jgi:succinoglycan biosynthesis protein ExoM